MYQTLLFNRIMNATLQKKKLQSELDKAILNVKEGTVKNFDTLEDMMNYLEA